MSGINGKILALLQKKEFNRHVYGLDDPYFTIEEFFMNPSNEITLNCIENILKRHNKDALAIKMRELASIETGIRQFDVSLRDHVAHSMYSFLLGLYFDFYPNNLFIDKVLSWKLAALLHDIAYPIQLFASADPIWYNGVDKIVNTILRKEQKKRNVRIVDLNLENDEILPSGKNAFELINQRVKKRWGLKLNVREYYTNSLDLGLKDHGVIGALMILKIIDALYLSNNPDEVENGWIIDDVDWSYRFFKEHILDAVSAIAIHNIPKDKLGGQIRYEKSPICYMLVLCDTLQIWGRESIGRPVLNPTSIKLEVEGTNLKIHIDVGDIEYGDIIQDLDKISSVQFSMEILRGKNLYNLS